MSAELSAIVVCGRVARQARSFLEHLATREALSRVELVLVSRAEDDYTADLAGRAFSVRRVALGPDEPLNAARARAVELAGAPVVVLLEDHIRFAEPFVDAVLETFATSGADAVGWVVEPGSRATTVGLAGWLVEYAGWGPRSATGTRPTLPGHNCAYRRDALLRFGTELPSLMRAENVLHERLAAGGAGLLLTPRIRMRHYQFLELRRFTVAGFWYGWNYADARQRAGRWGWARRLLQVAGAPAVPAVRWARLARVLRDEGIGGRETLRCAPAITANFLAATAGETLGHALGAPDAILRRLTHVEMDFDRYVTEASDAALPTAARVAPPPAAV